MINTMDTIIILVIVALITALTRAIPYLIFGGKRGIPPIITYIGKVLPASIMIILVIYCLRNTDFKTFPFGLSELISVIVIIAMQLIKKNTFLSVFLGTACYMILIRTIA